MTTKRITVELTDGEWKELCHTLRHEFGEPPSEEKIEKIVKREVEKFVRDTYIYVFA